MAVVTTNGHPTAQATPTDAVTGWFLRPGSATVLAAFRIAVFSGILLTLYFDRPWDFSDLPPELIDHPELGGWLVSIPPLEWVPVGSVLLIVACLAAIVGWHTRPASATATALAVWILGIPQIFGKVDHCHHLLWFGMLVALSPSGDALSIDARRRSRPPLSAAYGFPLRIAWLLIGLIYLSAGAPKALHGLDWALSDNVRNQMWKTWYISGFDPLIRFDQLPIFYQGAGLFTIAFELLFLPAVIWRPTRRIAVACGLLFHLSTGLVLGIFFHTLIASYVVFIERNGSSHQQADTRQPSASVVVAAFALLVAVFYTALHGVGGAWPVASYPKFNATSQFITNYHAIGDGDEVENPFSIPDRRWYFLLGSIADDPVALQALADRVDVDELEVVTTTINADPGAR